MEGEDEIYGQKTNITVDGTANANGTRLILSVLSVFLSLLFVSVHLLNF